MLNSVDMPPLLYLPADAVVDAMPSIAEGLALARRTLTALVDSADLPTKVGVRTRSKENFSAAMPALLRGPATDGSADLLGMKWAFSFPGNSRLGLPAVHATVILNDPITGIPLAIIDGGPITARRTAAISGVVLQSWEAGGAGGGRIALVGAGVQGRSHVDMLAHTAPGTALTVIDSDPHRAAALAEHARDTGRFANVGHGSDTAAAVVQADVVLTMVAFGPKRQSLPLWAFEHARLVVAVDYDMCVPAELARGASQFLVDDVDQFVAARHGDVFLNYPDPSASIGEVLIAGPSKTVAGAPVVVCHLGVGLADVVFADAIVRRARERGLGIELPR